MRSAASSGGRDAPWHARGLCCGVVGCAWHFFAQRHLAVTVTTERGAGGAVP